MTIKTSILILLVLSGLFIIAPGVKNNACAQTGQIAQQTCDTQVWQTMEARARLETEREIMQNQNLIFKADSILHYTCFDSFAAHAAKNVGVLFTHTTYFNGKLIIPWGPQYGMDTAMQNVVLEAMKSYVGQPTDGNFAHPFLGGRGYELGLQDPIITDVPSQGADYNCNAMSYVWKAAKCMNFMHTDNFALTDGFYPFINLTPTQGGQAVEGYEGKNDVREYPEPCSGSTPITGSTWLDMYRLSRNENSFGVGDPLYQYQTPLRNNFDDVRKMVTPAACADPVPTGIQVILNVGSTPYPDGVCTNPGCSYVQQSRKCVPSAPTSGGGAGNGGGQQTP